jgi:signal transduction histidine kinase/DNA-binding response OmpR family regulator
MTELVMPHGDPVDILVVDDSAENRLTLQSILTEPGQGVVTAGSGREALRCLLAQEFAVILLDVNMPIMDGFETASLVRQRKSSERTPIIFITAFSDEVHISRGYSLGAVDYIVSPVVPEVLRSKVAVFVDLFRKAQQIRRQAESLRRRADQLARLAAASLAINSANTLETILEVVTETARDLVGARCATTITTLGRGDTVVHRPLATAPAPYAAPPGAAVTATAATAAAGTDGAGTGLAAAEDDAYAVLTAQGSAVTAGIGDTSRPLLLTPREIAGDPRWRLLMDGCGAETSGWLATPLTSRDGRTVGWVHLAGRTEGEFGDDDSAILTQVAQIGSIAIENLLSLEAREANRLKDEFLTTLSHELRTPLTAIVGWTRILRAAPPDAARLEHGLTVIERNVLAQTKLIEDLLDVSRIYAGKLRVNLLPIPLLATVEAAVEGMRPSADAKRLALGVRIDPGVDAQSAIAGDTDRLQQVALNLISNAIKFTPSGGHIEVSVSRREQSFQVTVRDDGKGISPQFLRHVFDRFRQDDSSDIRDQGGLGVGLAIVHHIVELHGGRVEASSPGPGLGATFTVTLPALVEPAEPLARPTDPPAASAAAGPPAQGAWAVPAGAVGAVGAAPVAAGSPDPAALPHPDLLAQVKVLVVDDEPDAREILSEILTTAGATTAMAASLTDALAQFDDFQPDVLLSDIAMPGGDGYALLRQLRRRGHARGGAVPAIAVSAHVRGGDQQRALAAGFERYVTKPVEPAELLAAVREIVAAHAPPAAGGGAGEPVTPAQQGPQASPPPSTPTQSAPTAPAAPAAPASPSDAAPAPPPAMRMALPAAAPGARRAALHLK